MSTFGYVHPLLGGYLEVCGLNVPPLGMGPLPPEPVFVGPMTLVQAEQFAVERDNRICDAGSGASAEATALECKDSLRIDLATTEPERESVAEVASGPEVTSSQGVLPIDIQRAYDDLVSDLADLEPEHGFGDITDLPGLTVEDLDLIVSAKADSLNDVEELGLLGSIRKWLLSELQEECNQRRVTLLADAETDDSKNRVSQRQHCMNLFGLREGSFS